MEQILAWDVSDDEQVQQLLPAGPEFEHMLERWVTNDVTLVDPNLLLLGTQISTRFGTTLDLLGINGDGDLVVIELKRGRSPRDMVAQVLEYTAWVAEQDHDRILELGEKQYGSVKDFREKFQEQFGSPLPEVLNSGQRMLLVATELSAPVAAVVSYLSSEHDVPINAVTFALYRVGERRVLIRTAVIEESAEPATSRNRRKRRTVEELLAMADARGTRDVVDELMALRQVLPVMGTSMSSISLKRQVEKGRYLAGISIYPSEEEEPSVVIMVPSASESLFAAEPSRIEDFRARLGELCDTPARRYDWESAGVWSRFAVANQTQARGVAALYRDLAAI